MAKTARPRLAPTREILAVVGDHQRLPCALAVADQVYRLADQGHDVRVERIALAVRLQADAVAATA
jgi:hypothetical protein